MQVLNKNIYIIPLEDARMQIIVIPESATALLQNMSLCEKVRTLMKDIDST
jgi:hypothetical protein